MKNKVLFVVVLIAMFALAACGSPTTPAATGGGGNQVQPTADTGGSGANATTISKSIMLDPAQAADADSKTLIGYVYEGLVKLDNGAPAAALASSWTVSGDGLDYIFNLRSGATFHDGTAVNADAVIANINRWFDPKDANHGTGKYDAWVAAFKGFKGSSTVDGAEKVNETTVILHLNTPDPNLLTKLADPAFSIVSPAALSAAGFGTQTGKDGGSGAYKLGAWTDTGLTLEPASSAVTGNMEFKFGQ